jgi:hypothetical protein
VLALYVTAAHVESRPAIASLVLAPGAEAELVIHRWFENPVGLALSFSRQPGQRRPELGEFQGTFNRRGCQTMKPGATVRIKASADGQPSLVYEARPASAYGATYVERGLSTRLADEPGVYCPHPAAGPQPNIILQPGMNRVHLSVTEVDPPLAGEAVKVIAPGSVGIKGAATNVAWLPYALFLEPLLWLTQPAWLLVVLWRLWKERHPSPPPATRGSPLRS